MLLEKHGVKGITFIGQQDVLSLLRESAFVEASEENKGKNDYDKVLRFYVPIQINNGDIYPVRIVALHKKVNNQ